MEKLFITSLHKNKMSEHIRKLEYELKIIRAEQIYAYDNCGDGWHDNPFYSHLLTQEKIFQKQLENLQTELENSIPIEVGNIDKIPRKCNCVEICTKVLVKELNLDTNEIIEREIVIAPIGAEKILDNVITYNSPYGCALMGANVGEIVEIKIPTKKLEVEIIKINKI